MPQLVADHRLQLVTRAQVEQALRHRDVRVQWIGARGEGIGIGVVDDPDAGSGYAGGDGHLLHDVDELLLLRVGGAGPDDLAGAGGPQHLLGPGVVGVPGQRHRDQGQYDPEPRKGVVVGGARRVVGVEVVNVVAAEPEPGEEDHEANHQQCSAPAIGFLLLKQG